MVCNHDVILVVKLEAVPPNRNSEKEVVSVGGGALVWAAGGAEEAPRTGRVHLKQNTL